MRGFADFNSPHQSQNGSKVPFCDSFPPRGSYGGCAAGSIEGDCHGRHSRPRNDSVYKQFAKLKFEVQQQQKKDGMQMHSVREMHKPQITLRLMQQERRKMRKEEKRKVMK